MGFLPKFHLQKYILLCYCHAKKIVSGCAAQTRFYPIVSPKFVLRHVKLPKVQYLKVCPPPMAKDIKKEHDALLKKNPWANLASTTV